jgi:hypothetical protein
MPPEPLRTTTYILSSADALAYEQAAARLTPLIVVGLIIWLALCGSGALLIPADWAGARLSWSFGLIVLILLSIGLTLALLAQALQQWLAARRRIPRHEEVTLVEWPAHIDIIGRGLPRALAYPAIHSVIVGRAHLFLGSDGEVVIIPRRAFPEEGAVEELSQRILGAARPAEALAVAGLPASPAEVPALAAEPPPAVEAAAPSPVPPPPPKPEPDLVALAKALEPPAALPAPEAAAPAAEPPAKVDPKSPSA